MHFFNANQVYKQFLFPNLLSMRLGSSSVFTSRNGKEFQIKLLYDLLAWHPHILIQKWEKILNWAPIQSLGLALTYSYSLGKDRKARFLAKEKKNGLIKGKLSPSSFLSRVMCLVSESTEVFASPQVNGMQLVSDITMDSFHWFAHSVSIS